MKLDKIERGVELILDGLELPSCQHSKDTPKRVAQSYYEIFRGLRTKCPELKVFREDGVNQMVISDNIPFYSMCIHHFLPFKGKAKIGYIPSDGKIVGVSKLSRVLDYFCQRPTIQEVITNQVANYLYNHPKLRPIGVGVILKASHDCEIIRGVKKEGSIMTTSAIRGLFFQDGVRGEFFKL